MSSTDHPGYLALSAGNSYQMNRVLRHKLRNHSAGLKMTLQRIQEFLEVNNSQMSDRCVLMIHELEMLERFTERMDLIFADLPEAEPLMLFNLICELRRNFSKNFPLVNLEFIGSESAALFPHGNYLQIALTELLNNAAAAAGIDGTVSLSWQLEEMVVFTISNKCEDFPTTVPISPPMPFYTEKGRHDGLGLAIVERICNSLGGKFSLKLKKNQVVAKIELPRKELSDG